MEIPIQIPDKTALGVYPIKVTTKAPDGREFSASTELEIVQRVDLSGDWQFHAGDLDSDVQEQASLRDFKPDAKWTTIPVPAQWEDVGYPDLDGVCWYRTTFQVKPEWGKYDLFLEFGAIDDNDITYVNGQEVGHTEMWNKPRLYPISDAIRWDQPNVILVKVIDLGFGGGIWQGPVGLVLKQ